ncbi:protein of unknown function [Aminobacter niigataensis]|nr:protein of unknown function [Aminobacter niigataensis]
MADHPSASELEWDLRHLSGELLAAVLAMPGANIGVGQPVPEDPRESTLRHPLRQCEASPPRDHAP